jgi:DNA-directed RNA polymerase specialized sigma24 family protein
MMARGQDLGAKLDSLIRLTAVQVLGERTGAEAIVLLGRAGLDNDLIAALVETSPATVRSTLSRARRKRKGK